MSNEKFLNEREACKFFDVSRATLVRWRSLKKIKFFKLPSGAVRYRMSDLEASIRTYEPETTTEPEGSERISDG